MGKITEKSLVPKGLSDSIVKEVAKLLREEFEEERGVKLGISIGILKWREKNADERE